MCCWSYICNIRCKCTLKFPVVECLVEGLLMLLLTGRLYLRTGVDKVCILTLELLIIFEFKNRLVIYIHHYTFLNTICHFHLHLLWFLPRSLASYNRKIKIKSTGCLFHPCKFILFHEIEWNNNPCDDGFFWKLIKTGGGQH